MLIKFFSIKKGEPFEAALFCGQKGGPNGCNRFLVKEELFLGREKFFDE